MSRLKRIQGVYDSSKTISFDDNSRLVIFSDCHRGYGDGVDNFAKNQNIYSAALQHYYYEGFTYIELGDGDELWVNRDFAPIAQSWKNIFRQLMKFHAENRLYMVYGNHDVIKRNRKWLMSRMLFHDRHLDKKLPVFPSIEIHEGLIFRHRISGGEIFMLHGHQADFFNDTLWHLSKFLVRHIWRPLEAMGMKDPTSASGNDDKKHIVEQNLIKWVRRENIMMIAGHTHRSMFPAPDGDAYFNDGCCVHTRHITAIEIKGGLISLVKWSVQLRGDNALYVRRDIVAGPEILEKYLAA